MSHLFVLIWKDAATTGGIRYSSARTTIDCSLYHSIYHMAHGASVTYERLPKTAMAATQTTNRTTYQHTNLLLCRGSDEHGNRMATTEDAKSKIFTKVSIDIHIMFLSVVSISSTLLIADV